MAKYKFLCVGSETIAITTDSLRAFHVKSTEWSALTNHLTFLGRHCLLL